MATRAPTINGLTGAHEQPLRFGWGDQGPYLTRSWHGTRAAIAAQYSLCVASGASCEVKQGIGVDELEARYAVHAGGEGGVIESDLPIDNWEFHASHVEKDVLEADVEVINNISDENKAVIRDLIANPPAKGEDPVDAFDPEDPYSVDAFAVYVLMVNGLRSIRVNAPVLRRTRTVSNVYVIKAALTHVGQILSTATLMAFEDIPATVLFNLPTDTSKRTGLKYGWFKMHPTVRVAARQKMVIELEYEYGLWPTIIYGEPL